MQGTARHGTPGRHKPGQAKRQRTPLQARPGHARSWRMFAPKTGSLFQASHTRLSKHGAFLRRKVAAGGWFCSIHPQKPPPLYGTKCCRVSCCGRHEAAPDTHSFAKAARAFTRLASAVALAQDLPSPTRNPSRRRFITAFKHHYVFHEIYASRQHPNLPLGSLYTRADMSIIELALSTMCGWYVVSVVFLSCARRCVT